jgi:hypothetical protein
LNSIEKIKTKDFRNLEEKGKVILAQSSLARPRPAALTLALPHSFSPSAWWGRSVSVGFLRPHARALSLSNGPDPSALQTVPSAHLLPLAAPWGPLSAPPFLQTAVDQRARTPRTPATSPAHTPQLPFEHRPHPLSLPCLISPTLTLSRALYRHH